MKISQQLGNQSIELRNRYNIIYKRSKEIEIVKANRVVMALYGVSCGCLVWSISRVSGPIKFETAINVGGFSDLGFNRNLLEIVNLIKMNIEQIIDLMEHAHVEGRNNSVRKLGLELANAIDQANVRLYDIIKKYAQQVDAPESRA